MNVVQANVTKQDLTPKVNKPDEALKPNLRYMRDKDRENVKGIFRFYEAPGASMSFVFKQYKEDKVERYDFLDGHMYTVPLGVAKHLNKNGWYPVHVHAVDENGHAIAKLGQKVRRFGFNSLEFIDIEELNPKNDLILPVDLMSM